MGRRSKSKQARERLMNSQQTQVQINPDDLDDVACDKCGKTLFQPVFFMKRVSPFQSPNGREMFLPLQGPFVCVACGYINEAFLPDDVQDKLNQKEEKQESPSGIITTDLSGK